MLFCSNGPKLEVQEYRPSEQRRGRQVSAHTASSQALDFLQHWAALNPSGLTVSIKYTHFKMRTKTSWAQVYPGSPRLAHSAHILFPSPRALSKEKAEDQGTESLAPTAQLHLAPSLLLQPACPPLPLQL